MLFTVILDDFIKPIRPWDLGLQQKIAITQEVMSHEVKVPTKTIEEHIAYYAKKNGVDPVLAVKIARCESGLNPLAKNKHSSASGAFQHLRRYRPARANKYGRAGASIWDGEAQAEVSVKIMKREGFSAWKESKKCRNK